MRGAFSKFFGVRGCKTRFFVLKIGGGQILIAHGTVCRHPVHVTQISDISFLSEGKTWVQKNNIIINNNINVFFISIPTSEKTDI